MSVCVGGGWKGVGGRGWVCNRGSHKLGSDLQHKYVPGEVGQGQKVTNHLIGR